MAKKKKSDLEKKAQEVREKLAKSKEAPEGTVTPNQHLADRIAGKVDLKGSPIK